MVAYNDPDKKTIEDKPRALLVMSIPYTSLICAKWKGHLR